MKSKSASVRRIKERKKQFLAAPLRHKPHGGET
jgi:hypothetical protein